MNRWSATFLLVAALLVLPAAQADYLQASVDAGRTGITSEEGPERDDIAFELVLPGSRPGASEPLIIDGSIYALMREVDTPGLDKNGLARVDLATAEVEIIVETEAASLGMVSDGDLVYVVFDEEVRAYPLHGGSATWTYTMPSFTNLPPDRIDCISPVVARDNVFLLCTEVAVTSPLTEHYDPPPDTLSPYALLGVNAEVSTFIIALDARSGEEQWSWLEQVDDGTIPVGIHRPTASLIDFQGTLHLGGISAIGDTVYALTQDPGGDQYGSGDAHLRAFRISDGTQQWTVSHRLVDQTTDAAGTQDTAFMEGTSQTRILPAPSGTSNEMYYVIRDLMALDPATGDERWRHVLEQLESDHVGGHAFAVSEKDIFVASRGILYKFDRDGQNLLWDRTIGAGEHFDPEPLILAGDRLYARTHLLPQGLDIWTADPRTHPHNFANFFYAYNPEDGSVLWRHGIHQDPDRHYLTGASQFSKAIAAGIMVIQGVDGTLRVLGHTPASLQPHAVTGNLYPEVAEEIIVDISNTGPGAHGPATQYRAAWGDGTVLEWQDNPVMSHSYSRPGERTAEFSVRNDAGQTATTQVTFHVGDDPPFEPSWLARTFPAEVTLGILGVLVAVVGGVYGIAHQRQRRGRLQRELDAVEAIYEESKDDPRACIAALNQRKGHARGLVVDGRLDETQFQVVRERIDDLRRSLRVPMVEDEWAFLPHGMVQSLRTMMEDGNVTRYERDAYLEKLEKTKGITKAQKDKVRKRVEAWFREDAGGDD